MKPLFLSFFALVLIACGPRPDEENRVALDRISYVYDLKSFVDSTIWKGFGDRRFDVPLVYYTDSLCYVANPPEAFLRLHKADPVYDTDELKIYKTARLDSLPFHMSIDILFGDPTPEHNYRSP